MSAIIATITNEQDGSRFRAAMLDAGDDSRSLATNTAVIPGMNAIAFTREPRLGL